MICGYRAQKIVILLGKQNITPGNRWGKNSWKTNNITSVLSKGTTNVFTEISTGRSDECCLGDQSPYTECHLLSDVAMEFWGR